MKRIPTLRLPGLALCVMQAAEFPQAEISNASIRAKLYLPVTAPHRRFALHEAARAHKLGMWCDACIVPVKPLEPTAILECIYAARPKQITTSKLKVTCDRVAEITEERRKKETESA